MGLGCRVWPGLPVANAICNFPDGFVARQSGMPGWGAQSDARMGVPVASRLLSTGQKGISLEAQVWNTDLIEHLKRYAVLRLRKAGIWAQTSGTQILDRRTHHIPKESKVTDVVRDGHTLFLVSNS